MVWIIVNAVQYIWNNTHTQKRIIVHFLIQALLYCPSVWLLLMWVYCLYKHPGRFFCPKDWDFLTLFIRELLDRIQLYICCSLCLVLLSQFTVYTWLEPIVTKVVCTFLNSFLHIFLWCLWMKYFRLFEMCRSIFPKNC